MSSSEQDRRKYKRVQAPVHCRPAGIRWRSSPTQRPQDISLGGLCIYSDDEVKRGARLELELFLPDTTSVVCCVEVVWLDRLPPTSVAKFDVGLKFIDIRAEDRARLAEVLE